MEEEAPPPITFGTDFVSSDGICQVTGIGSWMKTTGLHKKATLQVANNGRKMFLVVFSEKRDMYRGLKVDEYATNTAKSLMKHMYEVKVTGPTAVTIGGLPGFEYEIHGLADETPTSRVRMAYILAAVESPNYFHEILGSTVETSFKENSEALKNMVESFKELTPVAPAAAPTAKAAATKS